MTIGDPPTWSYPKLFGLSSPWGTFHVEFAI